MILQKKSKMPKYNYLAGCVADSSCCSQCMAYVALSPHISDDGCRPEHTDGRSGCSKIMHRISSASCMHRTPAGLPLGIPGIGLVIEGAVQHAPQLGRQEWCSLILMSCNNMWRMKPNHPILKSRHKRPRPKNLNLISMHLPVNALVSILHRLSGFMLFLTIPLLLMVFQWSLTSAVGFAKAVSVLGHPLSKLLLLSLVWAFVHHFLAGLRHLAMDRHWISGLNQANLTSKTVLAGAWLATLLVAIRWWW